MSDHAHPSQPEDTVFPSCPGLSGRLARGDSPATGGLDQVEPARDTPAGPVGDVALCYAPGATWHVRSGRMVLADGSVPASLAGTPGRKDRGGATLHLKRGAVWLGPGARANFGHFLFDAMTGLAELQRLGLSDHFTPFTPRLSRWQRDLLGAAGLKTGPVFRAKKVQFDQVIWMTSMNHYLHRNDGLLRNLVARFPKAIGGDDVLYLSRRGYTGRIMVNEPALERALAARGVRILHPQRMTVADQIAAMSRARAIVGPSGAALANLCFLAPGADVVELRPDPVREPWLQMACSNLGMAHHVVAAPVVTTAPLASRLAQLPRRMAGRYNYTYSVDIESVFAALDRL